MGATGRDEAAPLLGRDQEQGFPDVRDIPITPQPTRYVGAYLPKRHQPNPAAQRLLTALRTRELAKPETQTGHH
jgi:hypothetical protein